MVDISQAVENSYSYEAFGQPTVGQSDVANSYLFVGGYGVQWESTPSLYFMQARYYGPSVGRFISEDPYGGSPQDPLSLHRYLYCANGPVTRTDPSGEIAIEAFIGIILIGVVVFLLSGCSNDKRVTQWEPWDLETCYRHFRQGDYCGFARHCLGVIPNQDDKDPEGFWQFACLACCSLRGDKLVAEGSVDECHSDCLMLKAPSELPDIPPPTIHP